MALTWKQWKAKAAQEYKPQIFTAKHMLEQWGFPSDVDSNAVQILFRKGVPGTKNRETRRANKRSSEQSRRENLKAISTQEFYEWGRRNGYSVSMIEAAIKAERAGKRVQTALVKRNPGQFEVDHVTPQPTQKPKPLQARYNAIAPGDSLANRSLQPRIINNTKSDIYPSVTERQNARRPLTRSSAIRERFASIRFEHPLNPSSSSSFLSPQGSIEAQTNTSVDSTAVQMGFKLFN